MTSSLSAEEPAVSPLPTDLARGSSTEPCSLLSSGKSSMHQAPLTRRKQSGGGSYPGARRWVFSTLANREVDNKQAAVFAGVTVGGSSAINGMFFDRPSSFDFDAWAHAGSPEFDASQYK